MIQVRSDNLFKKRFKKTNLAITASSLLIIFFLNFLMTSISEAIHIELESSDFITCVSDSSQASKYIYSNTNLPNSQAENDLNQCHLDHFHYYLEDICLRLIYKADLSFIAFHSNIVTYRKIIYEITKPPSSVV